MPEGESGIDKFSKDKIPYSIYELFISVTQVDRGMLLSALNFDEETLKHREEAGFFSASESKRIYKVCEIYSHVLELFEGEFLKASQWLQKENTGLGYRSPITMLDEASILEDFIQRLEYGVIN